MNEEVPFIICPILVTTSRLVVCANSMSIQTIENINFLEELGKEVPYLIIYQDYGPDFKKHCFKEFWNLEELDKRSGIRGLEELRDKSHLKEYDFLYPSYIGKSLARGERYIFNKYFTQFLVCNFDALPQLIDEIKAIVINLTRNKKPYASK